jgi:uncharacterized protein (DUF2267 family)
MSGPLDLSHGEKLLVLRGSAKAHEAARAMADNHVGAVLVVVGRGLGGIVTDRDLALALARPDFDPQRTTLSEIMTGVIGACEEGACLADVLCTMKQFACRRVPLLRHGRPVGIVTLDDLILGDEVALPEIREIVAAQLGQPARFKPAGHVRPDGGSPATRRAAQLEHTYREMVREVEARIGLGPAGRADAALRIVLPMLRRRLHPDDARTLDGALPGHVLDEGASAPGETVTLDAIAAALHAGVGLLPDAAMEILLAVCDALAGSGAVSADRLRRSVCALCPRPPRHLRAP